MTDIKYLLLALFPRLHSRGFDITIFVGIPVFVVNIVYVTQG